MGEAKKKKYELIFFLYYYCCGGGGGCYCYIYQTSAPLAISSRLMKGYEVDSSNDFILTIHCKALDWTTIGSPKYKPNFAFVQELALQQGPQFRCGMCLPMDVNSY